MKKVVLVNQTAGYLMVDIVNAYRDVYDEVALIAGSIDEFDRRLNGSVSISKIIKYNRKNFFSRIITWITSTIQIYFLLLFKYHSYHVVYVTNPPLSYFSSLVLKNTFSVIVYDIYPDALLNLGISRSNLIFRQWEKINKKVFSKALRVYTLSDGMMKLLTQYCDEEKIEVIPNWSASEYLSPINKDENPFVVEYALKDKFVILYSGNIGYTHNVETVIEIAKRVKDVPDICILIIGEGLKKQELMRVAEKENLSLCRFLTWLSSDRLLFSLNAADISIVTLAEETAFVSVPSKTYNLLSVGSPLLCIAPSGSEIGNIVKKKKCGMCFNKNEVDDMVTYIMKLKNDVEYKKELSQNSREASLEYTYKNANLYVL